MRRKTNCSTRRAGGAAIVAVAAALTVASPATAQAPDDGEFIRTFDEVLRNPALPAPNLRYARMAIDRGELRKALAAYERVLANDPDNEEARAGLRRVLRQLEPATTRVTFTAGGFYETNPRHANRSSRLTDDYAWSMGVAVSDERRLFETRWRSSGSASGIQHGSFADIDSGSVGGRTGPVIDIAANMRAHLFVGSSMVWLDSRTFYNEPTAGITLEFSDAGPLKSVGARWGYQAIGKHISTRDGIFAEVFARLAFENLLLKNATGILVPYWRYSGVVGSGPAGEDPRGIPFPSRLHQLGVRADYILRVATHLALGASGAYEYRHYYEQFTAEVHNRRDHVVSAGGQAIVPGLAGDRLDVIASYNFEHRMSNDGVARYNNHIIGLRGQWRF